MVILALLLCFLPVRFVYVCVYLYISLYIYIIDRDIHIYQNKKLINVNFLFVTLTDLPLFFCFSVSPNRFAFIVLYFKSLMSLLPLALVKKMSQSFVGSDF